ncbi:MAG: hypothetical protein U9R27_02510 [Campylobacterota bacterium]|nr:hypothetical protein [Campylobacterota bacterium]
MITIGEIQFGIQKLPDSKKKEKLLSWLNNDLLTRFHNKIAEIDTETMLLWDELSQQLKAKGTPIANYYPDTTKRRSQCWAI